MYEVTGHDVLKVVYDVGLKNGYHQRVLWLIRLTSKRLYDYSEKDFRHIGNVVKSVLYCKSPKLSCTTTDHAFFYAIEKAIEGGDRFTLECLLTIAPQRSLTNVVASQLSKYRVKQGPDQ